MPGPRRHKKWRLSAAFAVALITGFLGVAWGPARVDAQTQPTGQQAVNIQQMRDALTAARAQAETVTGLEAGVREKVLLNYDEALKALDNAEAAREAAQRFVSQTAAVDQLVAETQQKIGEVLPKAPIEAGDDLDLRQVREKLAEADNIHNQATNAQANVATQVSNRDARKEAIPNQITEIDGRITTISQDEQAPPPAGEPPAITESRRSLLAAQRVQSQELKLQLERELQYWNETIAKTLFQQQRRLADLDVERKRDVLQQWQGVEQERLRAEADEHVKQAEELVADVESLPDAAVRDALLPIALENLRHATDRQGLADKIARATRLEADATSEFTELESKLKKIQGMVESVGLTEPVGLMLRDQGDNLPSIARRERIQQDAKQDLRDVQLAQFQVDDRLVEIADAERFARTALGAVNAGDPNLGFALSLIAAERDSLERLDDDYSRYEGLLLALGVSAEKLIKEIGEYKEYIDERVLWIRSTQFPTSAQWDDAVDAARWLFVRPAVWMDLLQAMGLDAIQNPAPSFFAVLILALWLLGRRKMRTALKEIGRVTARGSSQAYLPTIKSFALSFLIAGLIPAVLLYFAWRLGSLENLRDVDGVMSFDEVSVLADAVARGLVIAAWLMFVLESWRQVCRRDGLAEAHFQWSPRALVGARRALFLLMCAAAPLVWIYGAMSASGNDRWHNSLGRFAFAAAQILAGVFMHRLMSASRGAFREYYTYHSEGWTARLKHLWWVGSMAAPALLLVAAVSGFYYTAERLTAHWFATLAFLSALLLVSALFKRWIVVNRRHMAIQRARELRAAAQAALESGEEASPASLPQSDEEVDISRVDLQTRRLIRSVLLVTAIAGVWLIWINVLPALGILDSVELWHTTEVVTVEQFPPTVPGQAPAQPTFETIERVKPITLGDIVIALVIVGVVIAAATNVPGLMEMVLLQRLPLQHGLRYAITTVSRYVIVLIGVFLCSSQIGIGWENVQWLVAALGLGLGFGLQEIFANFVSGLIILFERPIRLGDVVTVGDVSGVVTRIRIRATTITDWDRKELIVPNKEFVTSRLLNWTLSDQVNRMRIDVGVAYGSDTDLVRQTLLQIAADHENTLNDPPPLVTFEAFGDSTLNFVVRAYLPNLDNRLATIHDLHQAIDKEFRRLGIEIAFPQLDLHVRSQDKPFSLERVPADGESSTNGKGEGSVATPSLKEQ